VFKIGHGGHWADHQNKCSAIQSKDGSPKLRKIPPKMKQEIKQAQAIMCCKDLRPFSTFEGEGFVDFCEKLYDVALEVGGKVNIKDLLSGRKAVRNQVVKLHAELRPRKY
jgi:hypothetical protein